MSLQHLSVPSDWSLDGYQVGKKVTARLLWVDVAVKRVGLTLQKRLVEGKGYNFQGIEIGDTFDGRRYNDIYVM